MTELLAVQVSAPRLGKVAAHDASASRVSIEPWPDRTLHPVLAEQALADGYDFYFEPDDDAEEAAEMEEPPSDYSRAGILETDLTSLQDLRLVAAAVTSAEGGVANGHAATSSDAPREPAGKPAGGEAAPAKDGALSGPKSSISMAHDDASDASYRRAGDAVASPAAVERSPAATGEARRGLGPPRPGAMAGVPGGSPPGKGRLRPSAAARKSDRDRSCTLLRSGGGA